MVLRTERGIAQKEGLKSGQEISLGSIPEGPISIIENGLTYQCRSARGGRKPASTSTSASIGRRPQPTAGVGKCSISFASPAALP